VAENNQDDELSEQDRRILAIEARTFRHVGAKERRIREDLGLTPTGYFVRLNTLLDDPAALRAEPALVHRLRARRPSSRAD
jgi:DNA-binding Lrp family transcriptional regulator